MTTKAPEIKAPETPVSTNERLEKLKKELPKIVEHEKNAESNKDYTGLNQTLSMIKFVLQNKPTQEEIDFARQFISELKFIKDTTKVNLENLKDEKILVDEINILINNLKKEVDGNENIDNNSNFEKLFSETKSSMILDVKKMLSESVDDKFKDLKSEQRENIKVAITSKLTSSGIADSLVGGFSGKIKGYGDILAKKDFTSIMKVFDEDKDSVKNPEENAGKKILSLLNGQIDLINSFIQKNKSNPMLETVLNSPKNIEEIKADSDINSFKPTSPEDEKALFDSIKAKIQGFDNKIQLADKTKEAIFDQVTSLPDFVTNGIAKFLAFFASIPILGDLIKSFLGLEGKTEKDLEAELNSEFESRKSTKNLQEYGIQIGKNGEKTPTKKDLKIKILEDKDLSNMKHKELKDFFSYCKEKQVKTTGSDFWYNVLEQKKVEITTKDGDKETKSTIDFNVNIEEKDFDANKKPTKDFFKKLNDLNIKKPETTKTPETKSADTTVTAAPSVAAVAAAPGTVPKQGQKPAPVETKPQSTEGDLPKSVEFDSNTSIAIIDGKKCKVEIKSGNIPVKITDFSYNSNGSLNISGKVAFVSGSTQFNEDELKVAFAELKKSNKFEGSKNGKTLIITGIA